MAQIAKIKKEIEQLPKQEYINLRQWFAEKDWGAPKYSGSFLSS